MIPKIFVFTLCYCFFAFSLTYGNVLFEHQRYNDFRINLLLNDLNQLDLMLNDKTKIIYLKGNIKKAPSFNNMPKDYQRLLNRLIPQSFGGDWKWHEYYFQNYFKIKNIKISDNKEKIPQKLKLFRDTMYHKIETNESDYIMITLK